MSQYDPEHPYSEEPTRATPRIDPSSLNKPYTQPMSGNPNTPNTTEVPYGSPPPQYGYDQGNQTYGAAGQPYDPYQPYDQANQSYGYPQQSNPYGQPAPHNPYGAAPDYSYGPAAGFAQPKPTNGMAIAALVCGLSSFVCGITAILAIIFGFIALPQAKQYDDGAAKGMAIAGIVLGFAFIALLIVYFVALAGSAAL